MYCLQEWWQRRFISGNVMFWRMVVVPWWSLPAKRAKEMKKPAAYKLGEGTTYLSACPTVRGNRALEKGMGKTLGKVLSEAGIIKEDIDIWNIYIAYPYAQLLALEGMGICERGQAGKFVMEGHTSPGGKCPRFHHGGRRGAGGIPVQG